MLRSAYSFSILVLSIDREEELVNLSLLPVDTGKPDVLPESLHLPLRLTGEEKKKYDSERMKKKRKVSESEQVIDGLSSLSLPCLLSLRPQYHSPTLTPGPPSSALLLSFGTWSSSSCKCSAFAKWAFCRASIYSVLKM